MSDAPGAPMRIDRDAAIDMAVFTGSQLYDVGDERHYWALTLIVSNLFELVGEGENSVDRFVDGFQRIAPQLAVSETVHGWQFDCLARAIRNWIDHGLELDRPQLINRKSRKTVRIVRVGFVTTEIDHEVGFLYDVNKINDNEHGLLFSPAVFWSLVKRWHERDL